MVASGVVATMRSELEALGRDAGPAVQSAVSKATDWSRVRVVNAVHGRVNVPRGKLYQRGVNRNRPITQRVNRAGDLTSGFVLVSGKRLFLSRFAARQVWRRSGGKRYRGGVSYKIERQGSRRRAGKLFLVEFGSGMKRVYARVARGRAKLGDEGVFRERFGPSIPHVAQGEPKVKALLASGAEARLAHELRGQVDRLVGRGRSRGVGVV